MAIIDELSADLAEPATYDAARAAADRVIEQVGEVTTKLTKYDIGALLGCERRAVEDSGGFAWTPTLARGTIVHKALELWVYEPDARSIELVEAAVRSVRREEWGLGPWLDSIDKFERAEVKAIATETMAAIQDTWPVLDQRWRPVTEVKVGADFGRLTIRGAVDLTLGAKETKVVVDYKTGRAGTRHRDDLFLYGFLETLRTGTPPKNVATAYVDRGALDVLPLTDDRFEQTAERIIGAARVSAKLAAGEPPSTTPSPLCRWCSLSDTCEDSTANAGA